MIYISKLLSVVVKKIGLVSKKISSENISILDAKFKSIINNFKIF